MDQRVHQVRLAQWSQRIIDRQNSGLTVTQWCESNDINKDAYYYWLRRVREAALNSVTANTISETTSNNKGLLLSPAPVFAELPQPSAEKHTGFLDPIENQVADEFSASVSIQRGSTVIQLANGTDERLLSFISEVIRNAE